MSSKKPGTLKGDLAHLPVALTPLMALHHWVLWRWVLRKRWTKPPFTAAGYHAKNNDPATWGSYESVLAAIQNGGKFDGIGFALLDTPFDVVDLDHCINPATAQIDEWAHAWIDVANGSYVERTPSGEGLRIIAGADNTRKLHRKWPIKDARPGAAIEIYRNCERYITITGLQIGDRQEIGQVNGLLEQIKEEMERTGKHSRASGSDTRFDFNTADNKAGSSKVDYDDVIQNGPPDGVDVSALFHSVVGHLAAKGMSLDEIVETLSKPIHGIGRRYPGRLRQEVERSFKKWESKRGQTISPPDVAEPDEDLVWHDVDRTGKPRATRTNTRRALRALGIVCRYDRFHDRFIVNAESSGDGKDLKEMALKLAEKLIKAFRFEPSVSAIEEAIIQLAIRNSFNPVLDYLDSLKWDGKLRLDRWLIVYLGAEDTELNREFGRLSLIAAVRRIRRPGTKFDQIVVLEGEMGKQKSMAIETMAGTENFSDQRILDLNDQRQQEATRGIWLYEIAELTGMRRADVEHVRAFCSRTHDRVRPAYGHSRVDQPRCCIFFATTNDDEYLKAADRRFWPVRTGTIDIVALRRDRDQLWAEASAREHEGISIVLDQRLWKAAGVEQKEREESDPWDVILAEITPTVEQGEERALTKDLFAFGLNISIGRARDSDYKRLSRCMRRLKWEGPKDIRIGGKKSKGYSRPVK